MRGRSISHEVFPESARVEWRQNMKIPDKVTDEQLEIIKATEGYIRVASVPGSGKTFVISGVRRRWWNLRRH